MLLRKGPHPMQITLPKLELGPIIRTRIQPGMTASRLPAATRRSICFASAVVRAYTQLICCSHALM